MIQNICTSAKRFTGLALVCLPLVLLCAAPPAGAASHRCTPKGAKPIGSSNGHVSGNARRPILITRRDHRASLGDGGSTIETSYYACLRSRHRAFLVEGHLWVDSGETFVTAWAINAPYIAYATEADGPDYADTALNMMNVRTGEKLKIDASDGTVPNDQGATYTITASGISDCGAITYWKGDVAKTSQGFCDAGD